MANTNVVVLTGRCTKNAELKYANSGLAICSFSLAVNERIKNKKAENEYENRPNFFDCVIYGNYGKALQQFLTKGKEVTVSGRLHQDRWETDGAKHSRVTVLCDNVEPQRDPKGSEQTQENYMIEHTPEQVPPENSPDEIPF